MYGGAGVWHHQGDTGVPAIPAKGIGESQRRVQSRRDGVEFEANVCVGKVVREIIWLEECVKKY
jgi:hypothetical protein